MSAEKESEQKPNVGDKPLSTDLVADQESYDFEVQVDEDTRLICHDFSLRCSRPDVIIVFILREIEGQWTEIGKATMMVHSSGQAEWLDIIIGRESYDFVQFPMLGEAGYEFKEFRGKGIGSRTVQLMLDYLRRNGIVEVCGQISQHDDLERATRFWRKNEFTVTAYGEPRGCFTAEIRRTI